MADEPGVARGDVAGARPGVNTGPSPRATPGGIPGTVPGATPGRWLTVLAILQGTSVTLSFAVRLDASGRAATLVTLAWLGMYALAAVVLLARGGTARLEWLLRYRLTLLLLVAGALGSTAWSVAPALTLERGVHLSGSTLVALAIGFTVPLVRLLHIATLTFAAILVASALAALLVPAIGIENYQGRAVWRGVMASKNTLGFWAATSALLFASQAVSAATTRSRAALGALTLLALVCLAASVSATSALALGCGALAMAWLHTCASLRLGLLASVALGCLALALGGFAIGSIDTAELIGRSNDLTGRAELWEQVRELVRQRPLTGYGYGTLWYPTTDSLWIQQSLLELSWVTFHAHNGPLQLASEIGLPLTALALVFALQQLVEIVHCRFNRPDPGIAFVLGFTVALLVSNYAEARLVVNRELYWIFMVALPVSMLGQVTLVPGAPLPGTSVPGVPAWRGAHGGARRLAPERRTALVRRRRASIARAALKHRLARRVAPAAPSRSAEDEDPQ